MTSDYPYIVADIGGTNARFGLVCASTSDKTGFSIEEQLTFPSKNFKNIEQATQHYMQILDERIIAGACLAVAGPIYGDRIRVTKLNWDFSKDRVAKNLNLKKLSIINDFAAHAFATPFIDKSSLVNLNQGDTSNSGTIAVLGPGTGFGVAGLIQTNNKWNVIPTEGGYITLSSKTELQANIIRQLSKQHEHVSIETVFSGPGLVYLYVALAKLEGLTIQQLEAPEICKQALSDKTSLSYRTFGLFCDWLGQATGDLALTLGANRGVYLSGGILARHSEFLSNSRFMDGFIDKGQMKPILEKIPVYLVTDENSALLGAATYYNQQSAIEH